jgi:hypothetical protein
MRFFKIHFNIILLSPPKSPSRFLISSKLATCFSHLYFITVTVLGEERSCEARHSVVFSIF